MLYSVQVFTGILPQESTAIGGYQGMGEGLEVKVEMGGFFFCQFHKPYSSMGEDGFMVLCLGNVIFVMIFSYLIDIT